MKKGINFAKENVHFDEKLTARVSIDRLRQTMLSFTKKWISRKQLRQFVPLSLSLSFPITTVYRVFLSGFFHLLSCDYRCVAYAFKMKTRVVIAASQSGRRDTFVFTHGENVVPVIT